MNPIAIHFKKSLMLPGSNAHAKQSIQLNVYKNITIVLGPEGVLISDDVKKITALSPYTSIESIVFEGTPNGKSQEAA